MVSPSYNSLKGIGKVCNSCYLCFGDTETQKRLDQQSFVKTQLYKIPLGDAWKRIAEKAFDICDKCTHENPRVFQFLENKGVRF